MPSAPCTWTVDDIQTLTDARSALTTEDLDAYLLVAMWKALHTPDPATQTTGHKIMLVR